MALYGALASAIDSATRRNVLPLLRLAPGQRVVSGRLADPGRHAQPGTRAAPATLTRRWPKGHPWLPDGVDLAVCRTAAADNAWGGRDRGGQDARCRDRWYGFVGTMRYGFVSTMLTPPGRRGPGGGRRDGESSALAGEPTSITGLVWRMRTLALHGSAGAVRQGR
jgi:hypothetical protein